MNLPSNSFTYPSTQYSKGNISQSEYKRLVFAIITKWNSNRTHKKYFATISFTRTAQAPILILKSNNKIQQIKGKYFVN